MQWALEPEAFRYDGGAVKAGGMRSLREEPSYLALAATCAIHALLVGRLVWIPMSSVPRADDADDALDVIWIERPEAVSADSRRIAPESRAAERPSARSQRKHPAATTVTPMPHSPGAAVDAASAPAAPALVVTDDAWQPMSGPQRPSGSDIDPSAFRRDPLARRDTSFDPQPAALEDAIQDRSFGGWMQSATKKRMCGDLRAALRRSPESTASIIDSMRRRGCKV